MTRSAPIPLPRNGVVAENRSRPHAGHGAADEVQVRAAYGWRIVLVGKLTERAEQTYFAEGSHALANLVWTDKDRSAA